MKAKGKVCGMYNPMLSLVKVMQSGSIFGIKLLRKKQKQTVDNAAIHGFLSSNNLVCN